MYEQGTQTVSRRRSAVQARGRHRSVSRTQEQARLVQLAVCLALFLTVFLWKGVFPQKLIQLREDIQTLISTDLDFEQAFSNLGEALADGNTVLSDLGAFCVEVFGPEDQEAPTQQASYTPPQPQGILSDELLFLGEGSDLAIRTDHYTDFSSFGLEYGGAEEPAVSLETTPETVAPAEDAAQTEEQLAVVPAGTVVFFSNYSGDPLPNNYTMDQISLGELETMTPVTGRLNSEYGYRDHPINGQYIFHGGVDIGGQLGDPIAAFAAGTVEYTGENDSYGLYLQLDHGNGVKSFYAHCSKIEVTKGQAVAMGDTVARIGSTGSSTGPHLHLELKYNKMHVDPAYYVEFLEP